MEAETKSRPNFNGENPHRPLPPPPSRATTNIQNPRNPSPPPTTNSNSASSSASFRGCCCCLCLLFSIITFLTIGIILIILLALKPQKPKFDLQRVAVQYQTAATPSLNIRLVFTALNPNKVGIKYRESKFTVMYRGIPLGKARVGGFYQEAHSETQVEATIGVDQVNLMQADAVDLIREASLNDRVQLRVLGDIGANIRVLDLDSPGVQVSVDCSIVISPRNQSLTYKQCGFDGLSL